MRTEQVSALFDAACKERNALSGAIYDRLKELNALFDAVAGVAQ